MDNKDRLTRGLFVFTLVLGALAGVIASAGALNYAHYHGNPLFIIGGLFNLAVVAYGGISFYRKYLKDKKLD